MYFSREIGPREAAAYKADITHSKRQKTTFKKN
jgi:hypothetical protein